MNLMSLLFPMAYAGQGYIQGQQQQTEWNAANQRNDLLNQSLGTQVAAQQDSWQKLQDEQQQMAMLSQATNAQPNAAATNGAPPVATPADNLANMAAPPAAAVIPTAAPATVPVPPPPFAPQLAGSPQQVLAAQAAPPPTAQPQPVAQQQAAAVAAGTAPPEAVQPPQTPAQKAATAVGATPATPQERLVATSKGMTPPLTAGATPPIATLAALPLQKFAPAIDDAMTKAQQLLDVQWNAGDLPRATETLKEILHTAPLLAQETRANAQLQMDQLKMHQFGIQQSAAILGNPQIKTVADLQNAFAYAQSSGALGTFPPQTQAWIQQRIQSATSDADVPGIVSTFRETGMTANQQAVDLTKQVNAEARAKEAKIHDNLAQIKQDWDQKYKQYQMDRAQTMGKTGAGAVSVPKNDIAKIDAITAPAYFGEAEQNSDDPDYQRFRETVGEDAFSRMQANKSLKLEQATQLAIDAAKQRGDVATQTTKTPSYLGGMIGGNEQTTRKFEPKGMTPDSPIMLTAGTTPDKLTIGRYYTNAKGQKAEWDGSKMIPVP